MIIVLQQFRQIIQELLSTSEVIFSVTENVQVVPIGHTFHLKVIKTTLRRSCFGKTSGRTNRLWYHNIFVKGWADKINFRKFFS